MPRKPLIRSADHPYHIVSRSNNRDWFGLPMNVCWNIFAGVIRKTVDKYGLQPHGFVLMDNHFHMIALTPASNLDLAMRYLMTETSRSIAYQTDRINHVFGGRYKWSIILDQRYYAYAVRYIFRNPVRAGICGLVEEYPWSTLTNSIQGLTIPNEMFPFSSDRKNMLAWMNDRISEEETHNIRKGLRRFEFAVPRNTKSKRKHQILDFHT